MMTGGGEVQNPTAGGPAGHIPVLRREALDALALAPGGLYLDGTFGGGGYTRAILEAFPDTRVLAIDRDPTALAVGQALVARFPGRLTLCDGTFGAMDDIAAEAGLSGFDGVVLDVGVSSMQFDEAARGFSFRFDAPLDMRMSGEGESAADILAARSEEEIADILFHYGEERKARPIARAIVAARREGGIATTMALAELVARIVWAKPGDIHPATRTFQALRIAVNDELGELAHGLHAAERLLKPGGRLAVVSFHSLEDRIVKVFFAARSGKGGGSRHHPVPITGAPTFSIEGKWPHVASESEVAANPRARSAKLRAATRTPAPARAPEAGVMALATLPEPARRRR